VDAAPAGNHRADRGHGPAQPALGHHQPEAQRYDYEAFKSAWARAVERSGVKGLHFHDLRAKALTDKEESHGMQAARRMGAHSTEAQTRTTCGTARHRRRRRRNERQREGVAQAPPATRHRYPSGSYGHASTGCARSDECETQLDAP
jgi:integrase